MGRKPYTLQSVPRVQMQSRVDILALDQAVQFIAQTKEIQSKSQILDLCVQMVAQFAETMGNIPESTDLDMAINRLAAYRIILDSNIQGSLQVQRARHSYYTQGKSIEAIKAMADMAKKTTADGREDHYPEMPEGPEKDRKNAIIYALEDDD